ncbi:MAG: lytic transglycosylase domain-containing protein [Pseudohaliea sp.]
MISAYRRHSPRRPPRPLRRAAGALLLALAASQAGAAPVPPDNARSVTVPLHLDAALLQRLLERQLFSGPAGTHDLLGGRVNCSQLILSEPSLTPQAGQLGLVARMQARLGVGASGACTTLLRWRGRLDLTGMPALREAGTAVGFEPARTRLLDSNGEPLPADHRLQQLAENGARAFFADYRVDLRPQLEAMSALLPEVLPRQSRAQIDALLDSLRLTALRVDGEGVGADVRFTVEPAGEPAPPAAPLSAAERDRWQARWQQMDALLVLAVKHYAAATQLEALREALLEVLIESRYRLDDMLASTAVGAADPVRAWFLDSWQALAPVLRRIALEQPGEEPLLLFSALAAADALAALDELGPGVGLDISADGLRRLARLLGGEDGDALLRYSSELDPVLERLFRAHLEGPLAAGWRLDLSPFPSAVAAPADRLNRWAPQRDDLAEYLPEVAALLETAIGEALDGRELAPDYRTLFRHLVLATAWQESCWRHYVVSEDRKLVPLRSGTGDVGLMQVNERVWRGFYDQQRLRWDIAYNGTAGTEVLLDYLVRYALRKGEHRQPGGIENLARASYSAYNGGPSRLTRYRNANASAYGRKVDKAFREKYRQVSAGNELAVSRCLGGNLSGRAATGGPPSGAGTAAQQFTLQLGAFSTRTAAQRFISEHRLAEAAWLQRGDSGGAARYLVLYGRYATRAAGESARAALPGLEAWLRPLEAPRSDGGT